MSDRYYNDLREFIDVLDNRGLLYRAARKGAALQRLSRLLDGGSGGARRAGQHE